MEIFQALLRKELIALLLLLNTWMIDRTFMRRFNTCEILEKNPVAVAVALAAFIIGVALC